MLRWLLSLSLFFTCVSVSVAQSTHRLHDGVTAFVNNADGKDFTVHLAVRDLNLFETGPREVLVKVYDPAGNAVVRKVIPDDGVVSKAFLPPIGAWDHEAWYYAYCYMKGTQPMFRWSAFSEPDRLGSIAKRDFAFPIKGGIKGVYRILIVGCIDHYVTLKIDPALPYAIAGHPDWIHGHGKQWQKSFVYVPRGSVGLFATFAEYDEPRKRQVVVRAPDGKELIVSKAGQMFWKDQITFDKPGQYDDQLLTVEVAPGPGDFLLGLKFRLEKNADVNYRGERIAPAVYAPDEATAKAAKGGAIYHDGQVFWHGFQVRLHDWLKKLTPADFEVKTPDGKPADPAVGYGKSPKGLVALPTRPNFLPVNGVHWRSPVSDVIMHNYPAHKNRQALNIALRDMHAGLRAVGPHDHVSIAIGGPFSNLAYEFANYAWHYWRPAWHVLKHSDAPDDVKAIVHEAFLVTGDRLAFCRTWERVNGNAYAQVLASLRYCHEATGDPMQKELFDTYWQRFTTGGWGERVGVGPSGPVQEGFGYAYHYASYILTTWQAIRADFPDDQRFAKVHDGVNRWFSYTRADENVACGPWSTRTSFYPEGGLGPKDGPFAWKGLPGPDFTDSVNNADEFFAARRKNYYALTYHGRLSPKWESNAHPGQSGYGGGMLCQLQVPGKGLVIASTLNASYGEGMDVSLWRDFHLHTLAGIQADGAPFVAGDSEHADAKMIKNEVVSSGEIRNTPLRIRRTFAFKADEIACSLQLDETSYGDLLNLWLKNALRGKVREAYEIIPFQPNQRVKGKKEATMVTLLDAEGKSLKPLEKEPAEAAGVLIDRGGFGVRIVFDKARPVMRGLNNTVMIRLADKTVAAREVSMSYRLVPFGN